jgi:broad specificity phosphatase PhoE
MQMNIVQRSIWLCCHGESVLFAEGKVGGDSQLSERGIEYSKALYDFINNQKSSVTNIDDSLLNINQSLPKTRIISSTLQRAVQTVSQFEDNGYDVTYVKYLFDFILVS